MRSRSSPVFVVVVAWALFQALPFALTFAAAAALWFLGLRPN